MSRNGEPTTRPRLLVVEDDPHLATGLARNLEIEGFEPSVVGDGEAALAAADAGRFDLVVLDVMLPGMDGLAVCRRLRGGGDETPVLFLTARGSDADRLIGLRLGADDYLTKPFVFEELVLRIRGILRRTAWSRSEPEVGPTLELGDTTVHLERMRAETPRGEVELTERETLLLRYLAEHEDRVVPRGELLERVWGYAEDTATRTLDTFIHRLRKQLEEDPSNPRHFHTARGVGYRFTTSPDD